MTDQTNMRLLLSAEGLKLRFGGIIAADGINLSLYEGEHLAIIGPNGAGKTTFLNICTGYLRPQEGSVMFEGKEITAQQPRAITRLGIARAFQIHSFLPNKLYSKICCWQRPSESGTGIRSALFTKFGT